MHPLKPFTMMASALGLIIPLQANALCWGADVTRTAVGLDLRFSADADGLRVVHGNNDRPRTFRVYELVRGKLIPRDKDGTRKPHDRRRESLEIEELNVVDVERHHSHCTIFATSNKGVLGIEVTASDTLPGLPQTRTVVFLPGKAR